MKAADFVPGHKNYFASDIFSGKGMLKGDFYMKKIISIVLAMVLIFSMSINMFADHIVPGSNPERRCSNTSYSTVHCGQNGVATYVHVAMNGEDCTVSIVNLKHSKICASCGAVMGSYYNKNCTTIHSVCPIRIVECN